MPSHEMLHRLRRRFKSSLQNALQVPWNLPLPEDIFRLLVEEYLNYDRPTIESLSLTCKVFALFCRPYLLREVCIGTPPNTRPRFRPPPTLAEVKKGLKRSPYILDHIEVLRVCHPREGFTFSEYKKSSKGTPSLTKEGEALMYILLHAKRLKVLELPKLEAPHKWSSLPLNLQDAICTVFKSNALEEVSMTTHYPLQLVRWCSTTLRTLEYRVYSGEMEQKLLPVHTAPQSATRAAIHHLALQDPCGVDRMVPYLLEPTSPIELSALKSLTYFGNRPPQELRRIFSLSASTLESLKLYVQSNGSNPYFDFSMLSRLKHITLTIDRATTGRYGFDWMPRSLRSFENAASCRLESVELIIRGGRYFASNIDEGDWPAVYGVLGAISSKFNNTLRTFRVECCVDKNTWASIPESGHGPKGAAEETTMLRRVDLRQRSGLYKVEVALVEDHIPRWTYVPMMGAIDYY